MPVTRSWHGAAYGNGLFVITANDGSGGRIATSPDGINWTLREAPREYTWMDGIFGNGMFVFFTGQSKVDGRIMTSPDGVNWTLRSLGDNSGTYSSVEFGGGKFIALQTGSNIKAESYNGINWTFGTMPQTRWRKIMYADGKFIAVADTNTAFEEVYYSNS
jgi:hypothetical protein